MARRKNSKFWASAGANKQGWRIYFDRLMELSMSRLEWEDLPNTIDARFLELSLFGDGMSVFFKDDVLGFLALRCMIGGRLDVYQIPTERTAYASNGYNRRLDESDSVVIFNNMIHTPSVQGVEYYARRLWDIDRTIDVNAHAQKTPILILCDEVQRLSLKNLYTQYDGNEPVIYGDSKLNPNSIQSINTGAPYVCDKLQQLKTQIWNEALTYLGISNLNTVKKERLITDEVSRNNGGVMASRYSFLAARRQAADQINDMFGLNIHVHWRDDLSNLPSIGEEQEGEDE